jgi:uncharacterized protein (TIGR03083 family)
MSEQRHDSPSPLTDSAALVRIWEQTANAFDSLVRSLAEEEWSFPTDLPGWSVADIVAHVVGIESSVAGDPPPAHEPDWEKLPHVKNLVGRVTEIDVDYRRGATPVELLAELEAVIRRRHNQLVTDLESVDGSDIVSGPFGWQLPFHRLLQVRIFDIWTHEQDIRSATRRPGGLGNDAALVSLDRVRTGWRKVWSTVAPEGAVLVVKGRGGAPTFALVKNPDGRSGEVSVEGVAPALTLELDEVEMIRLGGGRMSARELAELRARLVGGEEATGGIAEAFLAGAGVTP